MSVVDIALFMPSLRGGGAERVMLTLATEFDRLGYRVDMVLSQAEGEYLNQVPDTINIVDLQAGRVIKSLIPLIRYLRLRSPSVLLATQNHANCVAILAKLFAFSATRVFVRESNTLSRNTGKHGSFIDKNMPRFVSWLYPFARSVIAVSKGVADDLSQMTGLPDDNINVIYNPVVGQALFKQAAKVVDHRWIVDKTLPVVVACGRLTPQKDFATLIDAVALANIEHPCRLIILGDGELRSELQQQIDNKSLQDVIDLPGFVDNPFAYMQKSDVFVLSSLWEGLPNVLIQALALGTNVVSTRCPSGPEEILSDGEYGRLVPCGDASALKQAILAAFADGVGDVQAERVQHHCESNFGYQSVINQYLDLFTVTAP